MQCRGTQTGVFIPPEKSLRPDSQGSPGEQLPQHQHTMQGQAREAALHEIKESIKKNKIAEGHLGKASLAGQESLAKSRPHLRTSPDSP